MEAASAAAAHQSVHENDGAPLHVPTLVEALLEMRLDALRRLLPRASSTHKTMVLACPSFSGHRGYLIGSELFVTQPPSTTGVGVCAGVRSYKLSYRFGDGGCRSKIAQLLSLMHAQPGDTLLHLALRINGAHPADKVALVTELLGHGFEFALENASGQLPAVLDPPCFRSAFFKEIPHWRAARAAGVRCSVQPALPPTQPPPLPSSISHPPRIAHAGNPRAGELTATGCTASVKGSWALPGNGTEFDLRIGPDYKKFGKKAPSAENIYELVGADAFKRSKGQAFTHPALSLPTLLHLLLSQQGRGRFTRWCGWGALMLM